MFTTLILVLILLAAFALVWWGVSSLAIPQPVKTVILVILGLIALAIIYNAVAGGGLHLSLDK
jgi:hypothetical protein